MVLPQEPPTKFQKSRQEVIRLDQDDDVEPIHMSAARRRSAKTGDSVPVFTVTQTPAEIALDHPFEPTRLSKKTDPVRRVTLDAAELPQSPSEGGFSLSPSSIIEPTPPRGTQPISWNQNSVPASVKFNLYDDFMSPKKNDNHDEEPAEEIMEPSQESNACNVTDRGSMQPLRQSHTAMLPTLGAVKKIRFRFGAPSTVMPTTKKQCSSVSGRVQSPNQYIPNQPTLLRARQSVLC